MAQAEKELLIEIYIPFCQSRCACCSYAAIPRAPKRSIEAYGHALEQELAANGSEFLEYRVSAVRLYGSGLGGAGSFRLLQRLRDCFDMDEAPVTLVADPRDISADSLVYYRRAGIKRYMLRLMALGYRACVRLGCPDPSDPLPILKHMLHSCGDVRIGACLVYGVKEQSPEEWHGILRQFLRFELDSLELIPPGPLSGGKKLLEAHCREAREYLGENGFFEYAPLCFDRGGARDAFADEDEKELLALGLGAVSRIDGVLSYNTCDLETYLAGAGDYNKITLKTAPLPPRP